MPLLPKTTLYGCAALATLAASLPQPRGDGKVSLSLSLDAPTTINDISEFTIAGELKNEGPQDILVVKDPGGILYDFFTADALVFKNTESKEKYPIEPSFVGYIAKWDIETYLDDDIEEDEVAPGDDEDTHNKSRPNGRRASSDSESSNPSGSDDSHDLSHTETGLTGFSDSESGAKKYPPGTTLALPAGETVKFDYKAGDVYDFSKSGAGAYTFMLKRNFFYVLVNDEISKVEVNVKSSNTFKIQGKLKGELPKPQNQARDVDGGDDGTDTYQSLVKRVGPRETTVTTIGCGPIQRNTIDKAAEKADEYAKESNVYISAMTGPTPRYTNWFGKWNVGPVPPFEWRPRDQVAEMFDSLSKHSFLTAGDAGGYTYDCSCNKTIFAYVVRPVSAPSASDPAIIYLCKQFRAKATPLVGANSKAGTLIHEATHVMYHTPRAMDHEYSEVDSQRLAIHQPFFAATNADNYEFFAENEPPLA